MIKTSLPKNYVNRTSYKFGSIDVVHHLKEAIYQKLDYKYLYIIILK